MAVVSEGDELILEVTDDAVMTLRVGESIAMPEPFIMNSANWIKRAIADSQRAGSTRAASNHQSEGRTAGPRLTQLA
jgi:hypothetical protein